MSTTSLVNKPVGPIGYGLMGLTWRANPPSQSQAFAAMHASLAQGANFWNAGELYGSPERNSCHLLQEYFTAHPDDAGKVVLSIKGGLAPGEMRPDGSEANVRRSVDECLRVLAGTKSIDIFECARVDPATPIEETMGTLKALLAEGKIGGIGLSEVRASTIRRAAAVAPIAAVEVELSLWATDVLRNGVAAACADLHIPLIAYSPLSRGALTGDIIRRNADLPAGDHRRHLPRYQDDVLALNNRVTEEVKKLAERKGVTMPQIAIAWVRQLSHRTLPDGTTLGLIIPIPGATTAERIEENSALVELSDDEMREIAEIVKKYPIQGERYHAAGMKVAEG